MFPGLRLFWCGMDSGRHLLTRLLLLFLLLPVIATSAELPEPVRAAVASYFATKETETKGKVFAKATRYLTGDLDHDGRDDLAVLFTLEGIGGGGNNYSFFMAVFLRAGDRYQLLADAIVGGKTTRSLDFDSIRNGVIRLNTKYRTKDAAGNWDATCCPSGRGKAYYTLRGPRLVELNTSP